MPRGAASPGAPTYLGAHLLVHLGHVQQVHVRVVQDGVGQERQVEARFPPQEDLGRGRVEGVGVPGWEGWWGLQAGQRRTWHSGRGRDREGALRCLDMRGRRASRRARGAPWTAAACRIARFVSSTPAARAPTCSSPSCPPAARCRSCRPRSRGPRCSPAGLGLVLGLGLV